MLIYDVLHKETIYQSVASDLRSFGVKYRFKKSAFKTDRPENVRNRKVFKTPLSYQPLDVVNLASGGIVHVPVFVSQASAFLEKYLTHEGLFRKAGSQTRQKELIARLDNGGTLGEKYYAIDVANCLKTFFRDLPEPLIPYSYHDLFIHCAMLKSCRVQALLLACIFLPPHHLNTLAFFMEFLKKVSLCEKQNKMSVDNLAKVVTPNVMPLQQVTIAAVQTRLELHLVIVKTLIDNAESIGVLPEHIAQSISVNISDTMGSTDNDLDISNSQTHSKSRKKKHRSGSLTRKPHLSASNLNLRMINGLKKIVGKGLSEENNAVDNQQVPISNECPPGANNKITKKRKVGENGDPANTKKKRVVDKGEKSKKLRLSLDRFVPKNKQVKKSSDVELEPLSNTSNTCKERRWSSASSSLDSQKESRTYRDGPSRRQLMLKNDETSSTELQKEYNNLFIDADINLSDDSNEQVLFMKDHVDSNKCYVRLNSSSEDIKSSDDSDHLQFYVARKRKSLGNSETYSTSSQVKLINHDEEYVKIPKSEYEEIKNRMSAIESRISQEFSRTNDEDSGLSFHSVNEVQSEYEKTLEEARVENTTTTDYLAKKLGKELKIRRSGEAKIIRSPSARKIGNIRRRSQEKVMSKRVRRTASWHISHGIDNQAQVQHQPELEHVYSINKSLLTRSSNCPNGDVCLSPSTSSHWKGEEADVELNNLCNKLDKSKYCTLKRLKNNESYNYTTYEPLHPTDNRTHTSVRRVSSFHGSEVVNTVHLNRKVERLKKSNSQQNIPLNNFCLVKSNKKSDERGETTVSWSDAAGYFKSSVQIRTPVNQTGRASIAKLRAQNAGMVLAKAKLFDECTSKQTPTVNNGATKKAEGISTSTQKSMSEKMHQDTEEVKVETIKSKNILSQHYKENVVVKTPSLVRKIPVNTLPHDSRLSVYNLDANSLCKTPHIKKPLTVKTPKSAKLVRRPAVETRRTPLKAVGQMGTPKHQSPKSILKTRSIARHV